MAAMHDQTTRQMGQIFEQMKTLANQAKDLKRRVEISESIYQAILNFEPFNTPLGQSVATLINSQLDSNGDATDSIPPSLAFTSDLLSEGKEIEAVANITSNWRLMMNVTQMVVSSTNTGPLLKEWIDTEVNPNLALYGEFPLIVLVLHIIEREELAV